MCEVEVPVNAVPAGTTTVLTTSVGTWSFEDRLSETLKRTLPKLGPDAKAELEAMLTPTSLAIMAGILVAWIVSHAFGLGEIIDVILGVVGAIAIGLSIFSAIDHLYDFGKFTYKATTLAELDIAAEHLAKAIAIIGVQAVLAIIFRGAKRPRTYKGGKVNVGPKPPASGPRYKPTIQFDPSLPPGEGSTSLWGNITLATRGTAADRALVRIHELVHQFLAPKLDILRSFRVSNRGSSYVKSSLYRYIEEALAETIAQVGVNGIKGFFVGIKFPVQNGYMFLMKAGDAAGTLRGSGLIPEAAGLLYTAFLSGIAFELYFQEVETGKEDLDDDDTVRNWVSSHPREHIAELNVRVKLRMLNALLDGWVSDEDLDAIQTICRAVSTHQEGSMIGQALESRATELGNFSQRTRLRTIISRLP